MSKKHIPYFDFYPADFMNGVRGLTPQEVGVYTMLLCRIYEESGPVDLHHSRLATYCGMRVKTFTSVVERLIDLGKLLLVDGALHNSRAMTEISNRADKLKNKSTAGKASAEIRKEKQRQIAAPVEQVFNYTDTDTEADNNPPLPPVSEAPADEGKVAAPEREIGEWTQLMIDIKAAFEAAGSMNLRPDTDYVGAWRDLGYRPPIILAEIKSTLARKPHVNTLKYFNNQIREAHERAAKQPAASPPVDEGKRLNYLRGMVQEWQREPTTWPSRLGPRPGDPGCTIPANILAEFGVHPCDRRAA
ncbi:DUF1376 domain-containing protein [Pseudochelatococcus contaminans]|uniref:Uncharacterized protein YdaU (DUF1376 family) n=1 Tax=Pseudochelatococcus contaminans TaxID=1538103 RepID=A0A7W6EFD5_9HYPH|nr:DUF1376 domain-containing protein [Pseudochelatococcus contaminans]MBB3808773.1 uncharacterized protein YdaU (DUF1376 family) [Pseudochelatococcus contaminans]